jgi:diguanylate cyclase (GGDEF)-like protein
MASFEDIAFLYLYNQIIVAVVMVILYMNKSTRTAGSGFWTLNIILSCVAIILFLLFHQRYTEFSILISRLPIIIGSTFFALGFNEYTDKPFKMRYFYIYGFTVSIVFLISIPSNPTITRIIMSLHALLIAAMYLLLFRKKKCTRTSGIYHILKILFVLYSVFFILCVIDLTSLFFGLNKYIVIYSNLIKIGILTAVNYVVIIMISIDRIFYQAQDAQKRNEEMIKFKQLSEIDALTGLYNRRIIESKANELLKNAECVGSVFTIFMIDINSFKTINDVNGHDIGDKVLMEFSKKLSGLMRKNDVIGRWGGDEFIILSAETNEQEASEINERLVELVLTVNIENYSEIPVTISCGFGTYRQNDTITMIIKRADTMLYNIKTQNNRT